MRAKIVLHMDSATFDENPGEEAAKILHTLADKVEHDGAGLKPGFIYTLRDTNGNRVGSCEVEP